MAINFDNALGVHPMALKFRDQRSELLASNLANADTPNYKARDIDFQSVLQGLQSPKLKLAATQQAHLQPQGVNSGAQLQYRLPSQPSLDGNTVDAEQEQVRYAENALSYQFSLRLLTDKFSGLVTAIRGE
ncbi:MAG: flagellar basal body rod protein FlgB [Proteobacteria bacterium]|nr:flagellar basal body rod protein FlgB [Pseudomonadota bacterium]